MAMDHLLHGSFFTDPTQSIISQSSIKMFIDNASNTTNDFIRWLYPPPTSNKVTEMLQYDAQTWEQLLWTLGRLLNLMKCLFYVSFWTFNSESQASLLSISSLPDLTLMSRDSNKTIPIDQYKPHQAHKYLGNYLSPTLQMETAYQALEQQLATFFRRLAAGTLS